MAPLQRPYPTNVSIGARQTKFLTSDASMLPAAAFANVRREFFSALRRIHDECKRLAGYGLPVVKLVFASWRIAFDAREARRLRRARSASQCTAVHRSSHNARATHRDAHG